MCNPSFSVCELGCRVLYVEHGAFGTEPLGGGRKRGGEIASLTEPEMTRSERVFFSVSQVPAFTVSFGG